MNINALSRRDFLKATSSVAAGSFVLGFHIPFASAQAGKVAAAEEINAWIVVKPDDTVVVRIARSEMGQGTLTGLAQMAAEELECDWARVTTEYPTPGQSVARKRPWGNFGTGGSRGIRESNEYVRKGGAQARMMLIEAAANEWKVPAAECAIAKGVITHAGSKKSVRIGKVAAAAAKLTPPKLEDVKLKDPKDWKLIGARMARLDTVDKTTGKQVFGMDVQLPNMLVASMRDCPVFGGKVKSYDEAAAMKRPGVKKVVKVGDSGVAVIADTWWRANSALNALNIQWDEGPNANASSEAFAATLKEALEAKDAVVGNKIGDAAAAIAASERKVESVYSYPHQNHVCMETMNATIRYTPDKCEGWIPTQNGEAALAAMAEASGLPNTKCEVHKMHLGGGFGRRGGTDYVRKAVDIAKQMPGVPVKMIWSREEDMAMGRFHPVTQCKLTAGLDKDGNITGLHMRIAGQSILATVAPQNIRDGKDPVVFQGLNPPGPESSLGYAFPALLVDHAMRNPHVPAGFWRGVNLNQNTIYLECFLDEVAHATKQDPLALRRKLLANAPKYLNVLNAVAEKVGYDKPAPKGVFRGLAQTHGFGSYVAACAEVSVSDAGELKIHRIVAATDCGYAVNPQQIEAQVEGSFVYGLGAALHEACTVKGGRIEQSNFHDYPSLLMREMPKV
ncbi:MAG: xanthine dehydrogenase family protein molybdopterin-binding subunit, partial [Betaproteobacteria bacterium]|nr:xanthine dehydrogenase family protein molybdopterin-binding subunit [Betaproteobacteria bacterium]